MQGPASAQRICRMLLRRHQRPLAAAGIGQVPDEVVVSIFAPLSLKERCVCLSGKTVLRARQAGPWAHVQTRLMLVQAASMPHLPCRRHRCALLVCRRWRRLVVTPQLLHTICFSLRDDLEPHIDPRVTTSGTLSLAEWLIRLAAGSVQHLLLDLTTLPGLPRTDGQEVVAALAAAIVACATAGEGLLELQLRMEYLPTHVNDWWLRAGARRLRRLTLYTFDADLSVSAPLHCLLHLEQLDLSGAPLLLDTTAVRLPASLTRLSLCRVDQHEESLGLQVPPALHHDVDLLQAEPPEGMSMHACMHGCMAAWLHGCMAARLHGCMAAWLHGCMAAWLHGCATSPLRS